MCRYAELDGSKHAMDKEYRQMLSMYDDEFEDGTEAMQEQIKQVHSARAFIHATSAGCLLHVRNIATFVVLGRHT